MHGGTHLLSAVLLTTLATPTALVVVVAVASATSALSCLLGAMVVRACPLARPLGGDRALIVIENAQVSSAGDLENQIRIDEHPTIATN